MRRMRNGKFLVNVKPFPIKKSIQKVRYNTSYTDVKEAVLVNVPEVISTVNTSVKEEDTDEEDTDEEDWQCFSSDEEAPDKDKEQEKKLIQKRIKRDFEHINNTKKNGPDITTFFPVKKFRNYK